MKLKNEKTIIDIAKNILTEDISADSLAKLSVDLTYILMKSKKFGKI